MKDETSSIIHRNDGTSIIFAVFALIVLSILGLTIFSLVSTDIDSATSQILSSRTLFAAEAGWQIGAQAVWDDKDADPQTADETANGYYGISYLDGYSSDGVTDNKNVCLHGTDWDDDDVLFCILENRNEFVSVWNFQQRINLIGATPSALEIVMRARRSGWRTQQIILEYSTNSGSNWTRIARVDVRDNNWQIIERSIRRLSASDIWPYLMASSGGSFIIRARAGRNGRPCHIDWLALKVTTEVDALSEPWASNSYISLPAALGSGSVESITTSDESGKININYAPYNLMRRLLYYCGITPQSTANTLATNIVNYRTSNWFSTIEEVKQVDGITDAYFNLIKDDITVYSWINQDVTRPSGSTNPRPPVNINTASENVLWALIRLCNPGSPADDRAQQLVDAIVSQRADSPFTSMYSTYETQAATRDLTCFSGFIRNLCDDINFDWLAEDNYRDARRILNIADGSYFNRELNQNWAGNNNAGGVEFCYYSHTFLIESTGRSGNIERTVTQTYGDTYSDNNFNNGIPYIFDLEEVLNLPTYLGEPEADRRPYWREEH